MWSLAGISGMTVQRLFVRRFSAAPASNFALVDAVYCHATDIVDRINRTRQTSSRRIFAVLTIRGRCLTRDVER